MLCRRKITRNRTLKFFHPGIWLKHVAFITEKAMIMNNTCRLTTFAAAFIIAFSSQLNIVKSEEMSWNMRNLYRYRVQVKFFSQDYNRLWPAQNQAYGLNDSSFHSFVLSCHYGEKICYGAWITGEDGSEYWGVGPDNVQGCDNCCAICGQENPTYTMRP
jgi:hypothetical protein